MSMVPAIYQKYEWWTEEDGTNVPGMQELMKAAGTTQVGKDGRLLALRRQRRLRLGGRSGEVERNYGLPSTLELRRFRTLDEEYVAEKLLRLQGIALSHGSPLQW